MSASQLFPDQTVWVSNVDGFVWIETEPEAVAESDELHVSFERWTNRYGRHRLVTTYWVRTNVQITPSNQCGEQKIARFHDHLSEYRLGTHIGQTIYKIF